MNDSKKKVGGQTKEITANFRLNARITEEFNNLLVKLSSEENISKKLIIEKSVKLYALNKDKGDLP